MHAGGYFSKWLVTVKGHMYVYKDVDGLNSLPGDRCVFVKIMSMVELMGELYPI